MYVVCHKCAAAYAVEDRLVGGREALVQCPNCLHVQAVKPGAAQRPADTATVALRPAPTASPPGGVRVPSIPPLAPPIQPDAAVDDSLLTGSAVVERAGAATCRDCGVQLADAFDRALGICERCRTDLSRSAPLAFAHGEDTDRDVIRPSAERFQPDAASDKADESEDEPNELPGPAAIRDPNHLMNAAVGPSSVWRAGRVFAVIMAAAAVAGGSAVVLIRRRGPTVNSSASTQVRLAGPLEKVRQQWSRELAGIAGDPLKFLKQGEVDLIRDTPSAYGTAEKSFQKAFVLEPDGDRAIAGYVQAAAWGRGSSLDEAAYDELLKLTEASENQWGRSTRILVAHALLLLARPESANSYELARSLSEQAVGFATGRDKALAHLALASAFLPTSAELSIQNTETALKLDSALRRAYFERALARESLGDYRAAISDLEKRLSMDSDQGQARAALARIYQEVGEPTLAHRLYDASGSPADDAETSIERAVIEYQGQRKPQAAAATLRDWLKNHDRSAKAQLLEAWVHLAAAERVGGKLDAATLAAGEALKISASDPAAHLQLFLIALSRGSMDDAERHFFALKRKLGDPALEKLFEGRLALAQGRSAEAMRSFVEAAQLDPRRLDALLLAGAAAASAGKRDETIRYLVLAGQMDPTRTGPTPIATRFYFRPEESLVGAEGRVIRIAKGASDVTPRLYEGLIRFHQREWAAADTLLRQVLDVDVGNALAHALRALIALHKNSLRSARASAERAVGSGRGIALARYAYGAALLRSGELEHAQRELREAEALAPTLLAIQESLAEVDARRHSADAARARLVHVLRVDPSYLAAKRALYALQR